MRESEIEAYFVRRVKEAGGLQRKFVSPGHRGVPDRIVVYFGDVYFVELKAPGKTLRSDQVREHAKLTSAGAQVGALCTKEEVDGFIDYLNR
jgi:hypothetical protein